MGLGGGDTREGGRGCGTHCVCKLQVSGLCVEHDVQPAALEVRAVGSTGDLDVGKGDKGIS